MFYTVYKITNIHDGKFYIGLHRTSKLDDGYMGSGTAIKAAIAAFGVESFVKEYLAVFDDEAKMIRLEEQIVDKDFVLSPMTYNLRLGGVGVEPEVWCMATERKSESLRKAWRDGKMDHVVDKLRATMARKKANGELKGTFNGRSHSQETKDRMSIAAKDRGIGSSNPNFGKCWIHYPSTPIVSKTVPVADMEMWTTQGWVKGRVPAKAKPPRVRKESPLKERVQKGRAQKVSDENYIKALKDNPSIGQALVSLGLAPKGKNYVRAKRLLGYSDDVRLSTNGKPKIPS